MPINGVDKNYLKGRDRAQREVLNERMNQTLKRCRVIRPEGIAFANDGIHVQKFGQGEVAYLSLPLFTTYAERGWVEEDKMLEGPDEVKAVDIDPSLEVKIRKRGRFGRKATK